MSNPATPTTTARNAFFLRKLAVAIRDARMELREAPAADAQLLAWEEMVRGWVERSPK